MADFRGHGAGAAAVRGRDLSRPELRARGGAGHHSPDFSRPDDHTKRGGRGRNDLGKTFPVPKLMPGENVTIMSRPDMELILSEWETPVLNRNPGFNLEYPIPPGAGDPLRGCVVGAIDATAGGLGAVLLAGLVFAVVQFSDDWSSPRPPVFTTAVSPPPTPSTETDRRPFVVTPSDTSTNFPTSVPLSTTDIGITSPPTWATPLRPSAAKAAIATPRHGAWITPASTGCGGTPPTKPLHTSVPPLPVAIHRSCFTFV